MEENIGMIDGVLLMDTFAREGQNLLHSLREAGFSGTAAVINDDGFLPEDVVSVYGWFLGKFEGKPRYFNQIAVPDYWEIRGTNSGGSVYDREHERGRIFYTEPLHRRLVKIVDWLDERGVVRTSDHYNRCGALYARTAFNAKGQKVNRAFFNAKGQEIIVENYVTGDIILNEDQVRIFHTKTEFVCYFLRRAGLSDGRIFYNSLSTPFFVSQRIGGDSRGDVLFWQEPRREDIPGNMQMILNQKSGRTAAILVQKQGACARLLELGADPSMLHPLGFCYPFARENRHGRDVLICTNSERVAHCHRIVKALPELHFHIAAITEMSAKLMTVGAYDNVTLYPGVKMEILDELFDRCDFYLDINYESEIVSAVYRAFLQNQLIFAFYETMHNREYVPVEHRYGMDNVERMIADLKTIASDEVLIEFHLKEQRAFAMTEEPGAYREALDKTRISK